MQPTTMRDFRPLGKLGEGSFSCVYKVERISDGCTYALKKVIIEPIQIKIGTLSQRERENAVNEIRILASIEHDHIIGYKESFYDQNLNVLCIVMDFADGGDLASMIKKHKSSLVKIQEETVWKAIHDMLLGLSHLHSMKILHRDLKPANIFSHGGTYKLGDLNVSKVNRGGLAYTQTGTPYYASPEVWRDDPYNQKSDIWSLGCIVHEMCTLQPPFAGNSMDALNRNIQAGRYRKMSIGYSKELQQLVAACLSKYPSSRPSCSELLGIASSKVPHQLNNVLRESNRNLLQTIKMPNNLSALKNNLPKSKYTSNLSGQLSCIPEVCQTPRKIVQASSRRNLIEVRKENTENIPATADKARRRSMPRTERASLQQLRDKIQVKPMEFIPPPLPIKKTNRIQKTAEKEHQRSQRVMPIASSIESKYSSIKRLLGAYEESSRKLDIANKKPRLNLAGMPWW